MVSQDLLTELRTELLERRGQLRDQIASLAGKGVRADNFQEDESDRVDQHPADDASELFEREKNMAVQRTLEQSLNAVNSALTKMDDGTYGRCENCGRQIPEKRLRALPEATHCVECQA